MQLILASSSAYRRQLLTRLGIPFTCQTPDLDETPQTGESAPQLVERLAVGKAQAILEPGQVVIGSDQVATLDRRIIGKPGGHNAALGQLTDFQGREVVFYTSAAVASTDGLHTHVDRTVVTFRRLTRAQLDRYLRTETPYDCAGGFKCEGMGIALFSQIESKDPTALIGLPLIWVSGILMELGLLLTGDDASRDS